ncbi:HEPN/Toprim-associated domain-containing protein [Paraburkholderia sp. SIMBA_027]|uniref:HEPN/Toprim-associated domain-containing protein n=1 Tax=Paraburkholderia sp. SIMBA_027 TaxID=3085770 RepID=UPI00397D4413
MCYAHIQIGCNSISDMANGYSRWLFEKSDRVFLDPDRGEHEMRYAYYTTTAELRRRLQLVGFTRETLECEFREFKHNGVWFSNLQKLYDTPEKAQRRAYTVEHASLDDWLHALGLWVSGYMASRMHEYRVSDPLVDIGILKECFERTWSPHSKAKKLRDVLPRHNSIGFPCASLECLAVALLEVVKEDAPCELDVSEFVNCGDSSFDDVERYDGEIWFPGDRKPIESNFTGYVECDDI